MIDHRTGPRLRFEEEVLFALRALYSKYGYSCYRMNKFEEYDLYVNYRDFLVGEGVITFTDTNGRLMALKPDVTLSIVKHIKDEPGVVHKLYYNENVYRVSQKTHRFKEIMQVGLECIGAIDTYCICDVLTLAAESLRRISPHCVLDISHLGIISSIIEGFSFSDGARKRVLKYISEKNIHELKEFCEQSGVEENKTSVLLRLVDLCDPPAIAMPKLRELLSVTGSPTIRNCLRRLEEVVALLDDAGLSDILRIDFSVVNDLNYYNGIVFRGFVEGAPAGVLSGGQYDRLMKKMKHQSGAIGFAIYLDQLERLAPESRKYDVETLLLYSREDDPAQVRRAVEKLTSDGSSVMAQKEIPAGIRYKKLMRLNGNEVEPIEDDA